MRMKNRTEGPFVLSVISGKGGVGKSMTSVNVSQMLQSMGFRVALIDADIGLSNCSTLMNEQINGSVAGWIRGESALEDIIQNCDGLTLVTGSDDPAHHTFDPDLMVDALDQVLAYLSEENDFIIIDTPAGTGEMTLWALDRADVGTIILVDEPTAISDVYRLCKYVFSIDPGYNFAAVVNFAEKEKTAEDTCNRFNSILDYFLQKQVSYLGFIPASIAIKNSVKDQRTLLRSNPGDPIIDELRYIAENVAGLAKLSPRAAAKPTI